MLELSKEPVVDTNDSFESLKPTLKNALIETFPEGNERPCDDKDFTESKTKREKLIADINNRIENIVNNTNRNSIDSDVLTLLIILCGQNNSLQPWNTKTTVEYCKNILSNLLKHLNYTDISKLILNDTKINFTKNILQVVCSDLTSEKWKCFPASVVCYMWILKFIQQPELSKHLQFVLPPALLMIDDFVTENRINGAVCLNHIVTNTTIAELQFSIGEVIYNGLLPLLRIREAELIDAVIVALISLTSKLEYNLGKKQQAKWSKFDTILEIYLENMELEQQIDLRNCYMCNLDPLIKSVGSDIIRWSKRLLRIFDEYIQTSGKYFMEEPFNYTIKAIETFLELTNQVLHLHLDKIFYTLVIALHFCCCDKMKKCKEAVIKCLKKIIESMSEVQKKDMRTNLDQNFSQIVSGHKCHEEIKKLLET